MLRAHALLGTTVVNDNPPPSASKLYIVIRCV